MISIARIISGTILLALLATTASAGTPPATSYSASLETSLKKAWSMRLGEIEWKCNGTKCQGRGATADVAGSCRALDSQVGPIKTFTGSGKSLTRCNLPQAATLGSSTSVRSAATTPIQTTDLVIEEVAWDYRPPKDSVPVTIVKGVAGPHGPSHGPAPEAIVVGDPKVKVTIRNNGTARWASSGKVVVVMREGTPRELAAAGGGPVREGVSVVSGGSDSVLTHLYSTPPFQGSGSIPGSLGPGEKKTVAFKVMGIQGNSHQRASLRIDVDKYYTVKVDLQVKGEDQGKNDGADLVLRFNRLGQAVEPVLTQRRTDASGRGTVEVRSPSGK
ncbi:MAG: hypothetical protein WCK73_00570 [Deltaproteobacteria bacterium]